MTQNYHLTHELVSSDISIESRVVRRVVDCWSDAASAPVSMRQLSSALGVFTRTAVLLYYSYTQYYA